MASSPHLLSLVPKGLVTSLFLSAGAAGAGPAEVEWEHGFEPVPPVMNYLQPYADFSCQTETGEPAAIDMLIINAFDFSGSMDQMIKKTMQAAAYAVQSMPDYMSPGKTVGMANIHFSSGWMTQEITPLLIINSQETATLAGAHMLRAVDNFAAFQRDQGTNLLQSLWAASSIALKCEQVLNADGRQDYPVAINLIGDGQDPHLGSDKSGASPYYIAVADKMREVTIDRPMPNRDWPSTTVSAVGMMTNMAFAPVFKERMMHLTGGAGSFIMPMQIATTDVMDNMTLAFMRKFSMDVAAAEETERGADNAPEQPVYVAFSFTGDDFSPH